MKVWASACLLWAAACAGGPTPRAERPGPAPESPSARHLVERLCVEPLPSLPQARTLPAGAFYELPPGAFIAQGWDRCCSGWPSCGHRHTGRYDAYRCGGCRRSPCCCD